MSDQRWQRIEEICHDALEHLPQHRAAFVREACAGDEVLRAEVDSLIANQSGADALGSGLGIRVSGLGRTEGLIGTRIGVYRVISLLGTGGMGEVYRAHDAMLQRDVAIKVLPTAFTTDPDRLRRFEREARILASFNHPNIGAVYGLEGAGDVHALVMELVEGEDLSQLLVRGAIPLPLALAIARQIISALEAAHEKGIIHRDLKPANIRITADAAVKVLDFGLAKELVVDGLPDLKTSPTVTAVGTRAGVMLGTSAYMSPEQARGKPVDRRTDIWAFGCVVYEMLTGRRAFEGEDVSTTLANVLKADPNWSVLPATTPREICTLLRRCLQKETKDRYHAAADLRIAIEDAIDPSPSSDAANPVQIAGAGNTLRERVALGAAVIAALAALVMAFLYFRSVPIAGPVTRFAVMLPPNERVHVSGCRTFALSQDGTHLAYIATAPGGAQRLYLRTMDGLQETRTLVSVNRPSLDNLFFAPDGRWLGFSAEGELKKVALNGGPPIPIVKPDMGVWCGASWGPDKTVIYSSRKGLELVSDSGGPAKLLSALDPGKGERLHSFPEFLPGGKAVLFTIRKDNHDESEIVVQSLETGDRATVMQGAAAATYVSAGYLVYPQAGKLFARTFDQAKVKIRGEPASVVDGLWAPIMSVSRTGSLAYISAPGKASERTLVSVGRDGDTQPLNCPPRTYTDPRLSPDGRRLAVVVHAKESNGDIWICDLDRGTLSRLTFDGGKTRPLWSPNGSRIAFGSLLQRTLSWIAADGNGAEERLLTPQEVPPLPMSWSQDGLWLAYVLNTPATKSDIWILPLQGERKPRPFLQTPFYDAAARFSRDGRWLVYHSDESGQYEIYARPFPGPGEKILISTGGGQSPVWPRNGREVFYQSGDRMMAVDVPTQPTLRPGKPRQLFQKQYEDHPGARNYEVSSDGKRLLMFEPGQQILQINVVVNWTEDLKRFMPSR